MRELLGASSPLEHVLPHKLHMHFLGFDLDNQMLMALVAAVLMLLIFPVLFRRAVSDGRPPAGKTRNFFEAILEFLRVEVFRPALKENTERFLPFLWTLFFFILFCNLLGQIPFAEIITLFSNRESHLGGTATGTLTTTGALAVMSFFFIHFSGITQVARSLMDGTYGHHGHHEEHSSNGSPGHEAALDLPHMRGEGLAADIPNDFRAVTDPTRHYADDEHYRHHHAMPDDGTLHGQPHGGGKRMGVASAALLAVPLYFWNF